MRSWFPLTAVASNRVVPLISNGLTTPYVSGNRI